MAVPSSFLYGTLALLSSVVLFCVFLDMSVPPGTEASDPRHGSIAIFVAAPSWGGLPANVLKWPCTIGCTSDKGHIGCG